MHWSHTSAHQKPRMQILVPPSMSAEFDALILHGTRELVPSSPHQKIVVGLIGLSGNLMAVLSGTRLASLPIHQRPGIRSWVIFLKKGGTADKAIDSTDRGAADVAKHLIDSHRRKISCFSSMGGIPT